MCTTLADTVMAGQAYKKMGRYHDGLSSKESREATACGGFAKHQCPWSHEGVQLFTHSD